MLLGVRALAVLGFCAISGTEIAALYVDPSRFGAGVGSALLRTAMDRLRDRGADHATLWVFEANRQARAFYARYGFAPDGTTGEHLAGAPEIRMRASLASSQASFPAQTIRES